MATTKPDNRRWASSAPPQNVTDPDTTLADRVENGWVAEKPPYQNINWLYQRFYDQFAYLNEQGIAVWDSDTTYPVDGLTKGSDGNIYICILEATNQDPVSSPTYWTKHLALYSDLTSLSSDVSTNAGNISTNAGDISSLDSRVTGNESDINQAQMDIFTNTSDIATNTSDISNNTFDINQNTSDIMDNTTAIEANELAISLNTDAIDQNALDISYNLGDIGTLNFVTAGHTSDISALYALTNQATESVRGIAMLAEEAEATAGTNDTDIMTPLKVKNAIDFNFDASSLGGSGTWKDKSTGLIIQWGSFSITSNTDAWTELTFGTAFPNNCYIITGSVGGTTGEPPNKWGIKKSASTPLTKFEYYTDDGGTGLTVNFIAVGN